MSQPFMDSNDEQHRDCYEKHYILNHGFIGVTFQWQNSQNSITSLIENKVLFHVLRLEGS
jgi:predicted AAA+ superfamily ATPase